MREQEFSRLTEQYRRELQVHCYRMLGSFTDAEDHVQETMLRAWRGQDSFEGRSSLRAWLYRIATNACLDTLRKHPERTVPLPDAGDAPPSELPWLQPYPDQLLEPSEQQPDALVIARETIELAFLIAIQQLPPNQRAVLILRDVLDWPAAETAAILDTSVASVTSALQRARATMQRHRPTPQKPTAEERALLQRYMDAHYRADTDAVVAMLRADVRFTMPPQPTLFAGRVAVAGFFKDAFGAQRLGDFRLVATSANRMPAAANYLRAWGDTEFRALSLDVLRFVDGQLAEITTFEPALFPAFGLPEILRSTD